MRHESKFAARIRSGCNSVFFLPLGPVRAPEVKFLVVPDRLLDSIIDGGMAKGVARLSGFLPEGVSIDITSVDLTAIKDQLRSSVADRPTKRINRDTDCHQERRQHLASIRDGGQFHSVCQISVARPRVEDEE